MSTEHKLLQIPGSKEFYQSLTENAPEWFVSFREANKSKACEVAIPSVKDEEWKYTSLSLVADNEYPLPTHHDLKDQDAILDYVKKEEIHLVLVNGCFISSLSNCTGFDGLTMLHLQDAVNQGRLSEEDFNRSTLNDAQPFLAVNNAYHRCGAYVQVSKKFNKDQLIHIVHVSTEDKPYSVCPRNIIKVERSAEASVIESYICLKDNSYLINAVTDIHLEENAVLHYAKAQKESLQAVHIGQTRVWQKRDSKLDSFSFMNGAKLTRNNITVYSEGEGTDTAIDGLYLIDGEQHVDNHTLIDHQQPNCTSHQLYKGILNGSSRAVFNGKIFVQQIAQQTNSYQLNKNLLLGSDCRVDTKPQLEIFADDVRCTHGATIGQINEDEMFYLQSRCIPRSEALQMLCKGFYEDVLDKIEQQSIRDKISSLIQL